MPRFELVHNIVPPYRRYMFELMAKEFERKGWDFSVQFMAKHHDDRPDHWHANRQQLNFQHRFYSDWGVKIFGRKIHFNPRIIWNQIFHKPDVMMVAGMDSLTSLLCLVLSKAKTRIYWTEGNPNKMGKIDGIVGCLKRFLLNRCMYFAVPGTLTKQYLANLMERETHPDKFLRWPNLVDTSTFISPSEEALQAADGLLDNLAIGKDTSWAIWPARLSEEKGILEFLPIWAKNAPLDWQILILGEGPLRTEVIHLISTLNLEGRVHLLPYVQSSVMTGLYARASLMTLPSINDANPLSVVEALFAGLPLVVSDRIGNWPEAIETGKNGYAANPLDMESMGNAIRWATGLSEEQRAKATRISRERAWHYWGGDTIIKNFVSEVIAKSK